MAGNHPAVLRNAFALIEEADMRRLWKIARDDSALLMRESGRTLSSFWPVRWLISPSLQAAFIFRRCAETTGVRHLFWRKLLLRRYACDVSSGAEIVGPIYIPHPIGIVIGSGSRIGANVSIFQNVTLGRDGSGKYPTVKDDVRLFAGAVIVGDIVVHTGARVPANSVINVDFPKLRA